MKLAFEINPVFRRDSRVRWRGKAAYLTLLLLAVSACGIVLWAYHDSRLGQRNAIDSGAGGRELFMALSYMQLAVWLLIMPSLSAPGIAFERERGLLEALQLSGMRSWRIVVGKLVAVMMFVAQLLLVTAPPLAVCFMMGGVDYEEFRSVFALQVATIFLAAAIGIYFSSRARRSLQAVRNAYITILLWVFGVIFLLVVLDNLFGLGFMNRSRIVWLLLLIHPAFVMQSIFDASGFGQVLSSAGIAVWPLEWSAATVYSVLECVIALLLLWRAAVHTGRVLPDVPWTPRKSALTLRRGRLQVSDRVNGAEISRAGTPLKSTLVWEAPLIELLQFRNPVLQREVQGLLRPGPSSRAKTVVRAGGTGVLVLLYLFMLLAALLGKRIEVWSWANILLLWLIVLIVPMRGAYSIARERENGTWESLRLSLLKAQDIVCGKILAPLLLALGVLGVLLPMGLACVTQLTEGRSSAIVPPYAALVAVALLFAYVFFYSAWGLWVSWHCRSTLPAFGWTMGPLFIWIFVINTFGSDWLRRFGNYPDTILYPGDRRFLADLALIGNPFHEWNFLWQRATLENDHDYYGNWGRIVDWPGSISGNRHAEAAIIALCLLGCLLLWDVVRSMKRRTTLETEAKR